MSFRNASISAVFVVTGAFRGFKWSLGLPHRCAGFQPECRRNEFEGIRGNSRGFEGTRGKSLGSCSTGPNKPSFEGNGPKSACKHQSRPLWIASIFKLLNSEVPAIIRSSKTTKTIENFQKLQLFQASSMPCAFCKPGPIQNHGKAFLRSATC